MVELVARVDGALMNVLLALETPWLEAATRWTIALSGTGIIWAILAAAAFARPRDRAAAWRALLTVAIGYAAIDGMLKPLVALAATPPTYLFPSAHAAAAVGGAVAVSRLWPRTRALWWTLAGWLGFSRIYLGHHYPLEVAGGAVLGVALAFWVLGGRSRATYANTLPRPMPAALTIRP